MADEAQVSTTEEIVGQVEGSVASLEVETNDAPDVVPARDLMALKDKNEKLKAQLKEEREARKALEESKNADTSSSEDFADFAENDRVTLERITQVAQKRALKEMEEKLAQHSQKEQFNKKLDETVDKQLEVARQNGVKIPNSVDKTLLKALALANPKETISALAERLY